MFLINSFVQKLLLNKNFDLQFKPFLPKTGVSIKFLLKIWQRFSNDVVIIQDTSSRQNCLKLRFQGFCILADWSP